MEQIRICAFFDALGTSSIMKGDDTQRRQALIQLVSKLQQNTSNYSAGTQNLGLGVAFSPSAQVTTFSDNVAISFPLRTMRNEGAFGTQPHTFQFEASQFFEHLIIQCISAVWDGLKLGILFRGGVSIGRLVHNDKIIAGEALIKAVELEKSTKFPRIEIDSDIINTEDEHGNKLIDDRLFDAIESIDGRWFVKTLDLHVGYWRDHNYYRSLEKKEPEEIPPVLTKIKSTLDIEHKKVIESNSESALEKWDWFMSEFESAFEKGYWPRVEGALQAIKNC